MDVSNLSGRTALITGAASGIGRETALLVAQRGADLVLLDVDDAGLGDVERQARALGREVLAIRCDVADADAYRAVADRVLAERGAPDLLINNAGVGLGASFLDTTLEDWDWIVGINLRGVVHGCHFFAPKMIESGRRGHVVNVSSAAGYFTSQSLSAYCTTKFAVLGLSEALREELAPHGIGVTAICPGIIDTPITRNSPLRGALASDAARQRMVEGYRRRGYTPDRVARGILKAVGRNTAVAPISPEAWGMYWLKRFLPRTTRWLAATASRRGIAQLEASSSGESGV